MKVSSTYIIEILNSALEHKKHRKLSTKKESLIWFRLWMIQRKPLICKFDSWASWINSLWPDNSIIMEINKLTKNVSDPTFLRCKSYFNRFSLLLLCGANPCLLYAVLGKDGLRINRFSLLSQVFFCSSVMLWLQARKRCFCFGSRITYHSTGSQHN
jgi:hypothetical protein